MGNDVPIKQQPKNQNNLNDSIVFEQQHPKNTDKPVI